MIEITCGIDYTPTDYLDIDYSKRSSILFNPQDSFKVSSTSGKEWVVIGLVLQPVFNTTYNLQVESRISGAIAFQSSVEDQNSIFIVPLEYASDRITTLSKARFFQKLYSINFGTHFKSIQYEIAKNVAIKFLHKLIPVEIYHDMSYNQFFGDLISVDSRGVLTYIHG